MWPFNSQRARARVIERSKQEEEVATISQEIKRIALEIAERKPKANGHDPHDFVPTLGNTKS